LVARTQPQADPRRELSKARIDQGVSAHRFRLCRCGGWVIWKTPNWPSADFSPRGGYAAITTVAEQASDFTFSVKFMLTEDD
jgi:hypothetical protein